MKIFLKSHLLSVFFLCVLKFRFFSYWFHFVYVCLLVFQCILFVKRHILELWNGGFEQYFIHCVCNN